MPYKRRHDGRRPDELREVTAIPGFVSTADGSCLLELGKTRVICTASFTEGVPAWRAGSGLGWVTAEYGMLPASTGQRKPRPIGRPDGRGVEIQRIIGRVLRSVVRFDRLGENTITLDCDVLEADGGTRTAAINGAYVALCTALENAASRELCGHGVVSGAVAAVSVGIAEGRVLLDLDYAEDSSAEVDMNIAMTSAGKFVEIQGSSEGKPFDLAQLEEMLKLARRGIRRLFRAQRSVIEGAKNR
jgi:ribonuclease PH